MNINIDLRKLQPSFEFWKERFEDQKTLPLFDPQTEINIFRLMLEALELKLKEKNQ